MNLSDQAKMPLGDLYPFGKQLDSLLMPWTFFGRATDEELTAIHAYLVSLR